MDFSLEYLCTFKRKGAEEKARFYASLELPTILEVEKDVARLVAIVGQRKNESP